MSVACGATCDGTETGAGVPDDGNHELWSCCGGIVTGAGGALSAGAGIDDAANDPVLSAGAAYGPGVGADGSDDCKDGGGDDDSVSG